MQIVPITRVKLNNSSSMGPRSGTPVLAATVAADSAPGSCPAQHSCSEEEHTAAGSGLKILLIDDQLSERLLLKEILRGVAPAARMVAFASPREAIEYCAGTLVDLVMTDYRMPDMNGVEVIRRLRAIPHLSEVPIVCVTVVDDRLVKYEALEAGATDFLQRPIDPLECAARCRNLLSLRQQHLRRFEQRVGERTSKLSVANRSLKKEIREHKIAQSAILDFSRRLQEMTRRFVSVEDIDKRRLARELHDRVSSSLMAIGLHIGLVKRHLPADVGAEVLTRLTDAAELVKQTMLSSREISADLHPASLDYGGIYPAIEDHVRKFSQHTGLQVSFSCDEPTLRLAPEKETALFRIVEEALVNACKHGQARNIVIHLRSTASRLLLTILDDGTGFDPDAADVSGKAPGVGLLSMRARAAAIGGKLSIDARPGRGTRITIAL